MTSLQTCTVKNENLYYEKFPIFILHANAFYTTESDGKRIFERKEIAAIQKEYEQIFLIKSRPSDQISHRT